MKLSVFFFIFTIIATAANSQPIHFSSLTFRDALAEARRENKSLFIEIYTTWCTYCKQMERDVFTTKEAGDYYNEHFLNLRYDALKPDGIQIRKSYAMTGLPMFLYLSPDGLVVLKTTGYQPTNTFLFNADSATSIRKKKEQLKQVATNTSIQ